MNDIVRAQRPDRLPVVLSRQEVAALLSRLRAVWLMASLMYGAGLRLLECAELRVKDLNFDRGELTIRDCKGGKGSRDDVAGCAECSVARSSGTCESPARLRSGRRSGERRAIGCSSRQVSQCSPRVGVAMGLSSHALLR